jgi:hypothetical protein
VEDKKHARAALMLRGKAPASARANIKKRADRKLGAKGSAIVKRLGG